MKSETSDDGISLESWLTSRGVHEWSANPRFVNEPWKLSEPTNIRCEDCEELLVSFELLNRVGAETYRRWLLACETCRSLLELPELSPLQISSFKKEVRVRLGGKSSEQPTQPAMFSTRESKGFRPTVEQESAISAFKDGDDVVINALAGTGKTSTLQMISDSESGRNFQYVAFNRAIVDESRGKFPQSVNCSTIHSLAFRSVGHEYQARLPHRQPKVSDQQLAVRFNCPSFHFSSSVADHVLGPAEIARISRRTVDRFAKSLDSQVNPTHVLGNQLTDAAPSTRSQLADLVVPIAERMWRDIISRSGFMVVQHDHYLKLWALSEPSISADVILFDEAQDADPVMLDVVNRQDHAQLIYVGDSYQQIYEWRGAVNAMAIVPTDRKLWLTESFRFGQPIADYATVILKRMGCPQSLKGNTAISSQVGVTSTPAAVMCRTNAGVMAELMIAQQADLRTHLLAQNRRDLLNFFEGCRSLINGQRSDHPELAPFLHWADVVSYIENNRDEGSELVQLGLLATKFSADTLIQVIDATTTENKANRTISTVHRAKGREWPTVRLASDYPHPEDMSPDDLRVFYVAVTRARGTLDVSLLPELKGTRNDLFGQLNPGNVRVGNRRNATARQTRRPSIAAQLKSSGHRDEKPLGLIARIRKLLN